MIASIFTKSFGAKTHRFLSLFFSLKRFKSWIFLVGHRTIAAARDDGNVFLALVIAFLLPRGFLAQQKIGFWKPQLVLKSFHSSTSYFFLLVCQSFPLILRAFSLAFHRGPTAGTVVRHRGEHRVRGCRYRLSNEVGELQVPSSLGRHHESPLITINHR